MLSILFSFLLFAYFGMLGLATMTLVRFPGARLRMWLIAPVVGFSVIILLTGALNQIGLPVLSFARWFFLATIVFSVSILMWRRPTCRVRLLVPFFAISMFCLIYTGWPALYASGGGLGWIAYGNDDMANYCLAAVRHLHNGFFRVPTLEELQGKDYSQFFWFMHARYLIRYGSEILLSCVAGITGLRPIQIFMPTILALSASMVMAVAAFAHASRCRYRVQVGSSLLLSLSPLFLFGTYYQLIAQVAGLALFCVTCSIFMDIRVPPRGLKGWLGCSIVGGIILGAFCITYPEMTPFFIIPYGILVFIQTIRSRVIPWRQIMLLLIGGSIMLVLVNFNILVYINTILIQSSTGTGATAIKNILFPYYLLPSGWPTLMGFMPIAGQSAYTHLVMLIFAGMLFALAVIYHSFRSALRGSAYGCVSFFMFIMGVYLFFKMSDFGLYKLAMFWQPILSIGLASLFFRRKKWIGLVVFLVYSVAQLSTSFSYAKASTGAGGGSFCELPHASQTVKFVRISEGTQHVRSDISHVVSAKIAAAELLGTDTQFLAKNFFLALSGIMAPEKRLGRLFMLHPMAHQILANAKLENEAQRKSVLNADILGVHGEFPVRVTNSEENTLTLDDPSYMKIFNKWMSDDKISFYYYKLQKQSNSPPYLTFINSDKGEHFYLPSNRESVAFYQTETDNYASDSLFSGISRYLLFKINTTETKVYIKISLTRSLMGDERTYLFKNAYVKGSIDTRMEFCGNGAANLFIGPLQPINFNGEKFILLDFGENGQPFRNYKQGIMLLYNRNVRLDPRSLVAFARDISCVSVEDYNNMRRPKAIERFPSDLLAAKTLEFSGWFEDGWVSQDSFIVLDSNPKGEKLRLTGSIPGIGSLREGQKLDVLVNGKLVNQVDLASGQFDLNILLPQLHLTYTRIDLHFSKFEKLSSPDDRPVAALINFIGIVKSK